MPAEDQVGLPEPAQLIGKFEQLKQIGCGAELNAAPLQTHQQIGGVLRTARQLTPLLAAGPVHIHGPGQSRRRGRRRLGGQLTGGLQHLPRQWIQPVAAGHRAVRTRDVRRP